MYENEACEARSVDDKPRLADKVRKIHNVLGESDSIARDIRVLLYGLSNNECGCIPMKEADCFDNELNQIWDELLDLRGVLQEIRERM